jgi:hypothetical protein
MVRRSLNVEVMDDAMADVLRAKSPAERLAIANGMWRSARRMIEAILRAERPDLGDDEIRREVARRMSHGAT